MPHSPISVSRLNTRENIEDERWHKNRSQMGFSAQNLTLAIDDVIKAEGPHRVARYLRSGVPIYRDENGVGHLWNADSKTAEIAIDGFLTSVTEIADPNGEWYDQTSQVGIITAGEIYLDWLPVDIDRADVPVRFGVSLFY